MRKALFIIPKVVVGLISNLLVIVSLLVDILEFVKDVIIRVIVKIPALFAPVLGTFAVIYAIYAAVSPSAIFRSNGWRAFTILMMVLVVAFAYLSLLLVTIIINSVLPFLDMILDLRVIIAVLGKAIVYLTDKFLYMCDNHPNTLEKVYIFGISTILLFLKKILIVLGRVASIIVYPIFCLAGAWLGYYFTFIDSAAPELYSADFWMCVAIIIMTAVCGIYLAWATIRAAQESADVSDVGLFDLFEYYHKDEYMSDNNMGNKLPIETR